MSALRLIRNAVNHLTVKNFKIIITAYVRPHLEYCIQAHGPYMNQDYQAFERVQRRATKLVKEVHHLSYDDRLQHLGICKVQNRATRCDMIETYKILTGKLNVDPDHFFELCTNVTREHHLKLTSYLNHLITDTYLL